jgi:hypothetical protein
VGGSTFLAWLVVEEEWDDGELEVKEGCGIREGKDGGQK